MHGVAHRVARSSALAMACVLTACAAPRPPPPRVTSTAAAAFGPSSPLAGTPTPIVSGPQSAPIGAAVAAVAGVIAATQGGSSPPSTPATTSGPTTSVLGTDYRCRLSDHTSESVVASSPERAVHLCEQRYALTCACVPAQ